MADWRDRPEFRELDNPAWNALCDRQAKLGRVSGAAAVFHPEVSLLAAVRESSPAAFGDLAKLCEPGEGRGVSGVAPAAGVGPEWIVPETMTLLQMVAVEGVADFAGGLPAFRPLASSDVDEMLELTELTRPGPFARRTIEMGRYIGLREHGRLVAMAGERMALAGFVEVSAVCVHPDAQGRGLAAALVHAAAKSIEARGDIAFLHAAVGTPSFERATALYRELGFRDRRESPLTLLLRVEPASTHDHVA